MREGFWVGLEAVVSEDFEIAKVLGGGAARGGPGIWFL